MVEKYVLETRYSGARQGKFFSSVFVFFFFCMFDKEEDLPLLQLDNGGGVVLCFFCVSVSVSVFLCDKVEHWNTSL